jgi:YVTN family beta-propeller protein
MELSLTLNSTLSRLRGAIAVALATFAAATTLSLPTRAAGTVDTVAGMPPVSDATNLYGDAGVGKLSDATKGALARVYVPNLRSNDVYVIDPATFTVVGKFKVGLNPQHVVPSWDLKTPGRQQRREHDQGQPDADRPDDRQARQGDRRRRTPTTCTSRPTARRRSSSPRPTSGLDSRPGDDSVEVVAGDAAVRRHNHADFSIDGRFAIFTCSSAAYGQDRHGRPQGARLPEAVERQDAARTSASRPTAPPSTSPT